MTVVAEKMAVVDGLRRLIVGAVSAVATCLVFATPALGAAAWRLDSLSNTTVAPGGQLDYLVKSTNMGDEPTDGSPIVMVARLPPGMTAIDAVLTIPDFADFIDVPCTAGDGVSPVAGATTVRCTTTWVVPPFGDTAITNYLELRLSVGVSAGGGTLTNAFEVSGGSGGHASTVDPVRVARSASTFGFDAFDSRAVDGFGDPLTQAGAVPTNESFAIDLATGTDPVHGPIWPVDPAKDLRVDLPPGMVGSPAAVDQCTTTGLANAVGLQSKPLCPSTSQVGTVLVRVNSGTVSPGFSPWLGPVPIFSVKPPPGVPAQFGFAVLGSVVTFDASLRSGGDYGITVNSTNIPEGLVFIGSTITLWGVPASPAHDAERACPGTEAPYASGVACRSGAPVKAFLRNPTMCPAPGVGLSFTAQVDSWFDPGNFKTASFLSHLPPAYPATPLDWGVVTGPTGCARVPFDPSFNDTPASTQANSPSGFSFDIGLPQTSDPDLIGESDLKRATVVLPEGLRVSPSSASGLQACLPAQIRLHDGSSPDCPDASKLGSVTIVTLLLRDPLSGAVYLASPHDNPFGTLISLYLTAEGSGVVVKLAGRVEADPVTGQLSTVFDDNPQMPFSNLHLQLKGGPRAPLVLPRQCGSYTTSAQLEGWSGKIVDTESTFTVSGDGHGAPCPGSQFSPDFVAETTHPIAGASSTFNVALSRDDVDEELKGVTVDMPDGLTARIANVPLCSEADARAGSCPESSRVGSVTAGAGAGPSPFYITNGRVYLTGPYKGAPFGLAIVVPAVAGPFDLGNVLVRSAIFIDKHTARVRVVSDPLPTILQGIPLDVRDVRVVADRPDFFVNPTSCAKKSIDGTIESTEGSKASVSSPFQVGECANLGFKPRMVLTVGGRGHTVRGATTPLSTLVTMPVGDANLKSVKVTLPTTINARLTVINDACTRAEFEAGNCAHARAGTATAVTPLLRDPLQGNVYFVKNGHPLPDLFIALRGQVSFDLIGRVSIPHSKNLATTFDTAPDVPLRSFTLRLVGDPSRGSVGAATNLCSRRGRNAKAQLDYTAQNGRTLQIKQRLNVQGCGRAHSAHKTRKDRRERGD